MGKQIGSIIAGLIILGGIIWAAVEFLKPSAQTGEFKAGSGGGLPTGGAGFASPASSTMRTNTSPSSPSSGDVIPGVPNTTLVSSGVDLLSSIGQTLFGGGGGTPSSTYNADPTLNAPDFLTTDTLTALDSNLSYPTDTSLTLDPSLSNQNDPLSLLN